MKDFLGEARKCSELKFLQPKANLGDDTADFNVGYYNAIGIKPDYQISFSKFKKYADKNNPVAQFNLGIMYRSGHGVEKNNATAKKWFQKAADQGLEEAKLILKLYYNT